MKNIVVCCDGTNNQIVESGTNVLWMANMLVQSPEQLVFYDPGVGTMADSRATTLLRRRLSVVYGLAFGAGLVRNIEQAYRFLMQNYDADDQISLFGFSRGALTARAIAGMVHMFGLLRRDQDNLIPYLARAYLTADFGMAKHVSEFTRPGVPIKFLGLWDTVTSFGFVYGRRVLPYTANNDGVKIVRHAMAIDERRAYFRQNHWGRAFAKTQNVKEVWFPGVHSDVGGGSPRDEQGLSKMSLQWIVSEIEATGVGLTIDQDVYARALGVREVGQYRPNPWARAHESLQGPWWLLELLPKNATVQRGRMKLPLARRRRIGRRRDALVHQSVHDRMRRTSGRYAPPNLPDDMTVEMWGDLKPGSPEPVDEPLGGGKVAAAVAIFGSLVFITVGLALTWGLGSTAWAWATDPARRNLVALLTVPTLVLVLGAWLLGLLSNLPRYSDRVRGKFLYTRFEGYDLSDLRAQLQDLGTQGIGAFRRMLWLDLLFPLAYVPALAWTIARLPEEIGSVSLGWGMTVLLALPVLAGLADWVENGVLLQQSSSSAKGSEAAVRLASKGTQLKLVAYMACIIVPPLTLLLIKLFT